MTAPDRPAVRVQDLRGAGSPPPAAVLADPSGRRARLLHHAGRIVGLVFLLWFGCLVLAGLGLFPASGVPFGEAVAPDAQPKALGRIPPPRATARADLRPATALRQSAPGVTTNPAATTTTPAAGTERPRKPSSGATGSGPTAPGKNGNAPGQTTTTPGNSGSAPGQSTTTTPGNSGSAPGQTQTNTTGHGPPG